jgi:DNA-binding LacI/PurR family transcriptional regulator
MKRATITDVAQQAGVSIKTVSRVANGEAHVSDGMRRRVRNAIETLGYQANEHARQMGSRGRKKLAIEDSSTAQLHAVAKGEDPMRIDWD